ncbi:MAG: rRNA maturation RNase YbeY [bacterium]
MKRKPPPGRPGLALYTNSRDRRLAAALAGLARSLTRQFPACRGGQANVILIDDQAIARLNRRWRGKAGPTDVLSFPLGHDDPETGRRMLGEVYVSRDCARAQGREYGTGYHGELERLARHGLLHLLGLSHRQMAGVE